MLLNHYQSKININPKTKFFSSDLSFTYYVKENKTTKLEFYLYKNFSLQSIQSDDILNYQLGEEIIDWCPSVLESKLLIINLKRIYHKGEQINVHMIYQGQVDIVSKWEINRITEPFIELSLYSPYFPLTKDLQLSTFSIEVNLPEDYYLINGQKHIDYRRIEQREPTNDCTLIASNQFKQIKTEDYLTVYYINNESKHVAKKINDDCLWLINYFTDAFTETELSQELSIVILPRKIGGAYCRPGLIVFPDMIDEDDVSIRFLAHEISHLWWNKSINTNSWEDWLNESFAEFSSLMVYRDHYGETKFNQLIAKYKEKAKNTPPIYKINRSDEAAHTVLYIKGAVILYQLENKLGKERFIQFLKQVHQNKIKETKQLLRLLASIERKTYSKYINKALKE
ncbi:hypothetical protein KHQ81_11430 [Mycoplasmatota bacterium]|nr:hypothetical protein KHQ81_11430 [Mycoplasmatota bacterium]